MALTRSTPLKRGGSLARTRLAPVSAKRRGERAERTAITATVTSCCLSGWEACGGPIDSHELVARGVRSGSHLERELVIGLCRLHHRRVTDEPATGELVGARIESWAYAKWGPVVLEEAARRRVMTQRLGEIPDTERWRSWDPNDE